VHRSTICNSAQPAAGFSSLPGVAGTYLEAAVMDVVDWFLLAALWSISRSA
jgi:hypothetical protein